MCGIAGLVGNFSDEQLLPRMLSVLKHRGPDSCGFYRSENVSIGHCRLSIVDISARAAQPFVSQDNLVAIAVNGEVYNYLSIRELLQKKGYNFRSASDSEVVLHAYLDRGLEFVRELNGMFAISIWDARIKSLFLIRDRLGIKPLYYTKIGSGLIFASEIKALACCSEVEFSIDHQSFGEYLAFENYFSGRTLNKNIKLVQPGEIVRFSLSEDLIKKSYFWQPKLDISREDADETLVDKYSALIESSVNRHLVSDVALGSYLSSGIDSSSVAYYASRKIPKLNTYTGCFGMPGFYDEATAASETAAKFGCLNTGVRITPDDFVDNIEKILWHIDEPRVGMGVFSQYMVAKQASQKVKVILTGHGGDELFAGYPVFKAIYGKQNIGRFILSSSLREMAFFMYFSVFPVLRKEAGYFFPNIFSLKSLEYFLKPDFYSELSKNSEILTELSSLKSSSDNEYEGLTLAYLKHYLPSLFIIEDKLSMAFSLESRTPLCDNEMVDFALSISLSAKLRGYELKHIPRRAMEAKLPHHLYRLPKRGFPTPLRHWFRRELKDYIRSFICDNLSVIPMFDRRAIEKMLKEYQRSRVNSPLDEIAAHKIWIVFNLIHYFNNQNRRYNLGLVN